MGRGSRDQKLERPSRRGPKGPFKWTDERIRRRLHGLFNRGQLPKGRFPTQRELAEADPHLADAVKRHGGSSRWAAEVGLVLPGAQRRRALSEAEAIAAATAVIEEIGRLPNEQRLRELGHRSLAAAVRRVGGARAFAERYGLEEKTEDP